MFCYKSIEFSNPNISFQEKRNIIYNDLESALIDNGYNPPFDITKNEKGKPFFKRKDLPFFSISHSNRFAAFSISDSSVGIDIEDLSISRNRTDKVKERFFCTNEKNHIITDEQFIKIWTAKEALMKASGNSLVEVLTECDLSDMLFYDEYEYILSDIRYRFLYKHNKTHIMTVCTCINS